jgi:hypothetical protein
VVAKRFDSAFALRRHDFDGAIDERCKTAKHLVVVFTKVEKVGFLFSFQNQIHPNGRR